MLPPRNTSHHKRHKKGVPTSRPREQVGVTVQYLKKDYKPKLVRKDNEGYFIPMKGTLHQDDTKILNIYGPNAYIQFHKVHPTKLKATDSPQHRNSDFSIIYHSHQQIGHPHKKENYLKLHHRSNGSIRFLQNIPSKYEEFFSTAHKTFYKVDHI